MPKQRASVGSFRVGRAETDQGNIGNTGGGQRLDKWLWYTRIVKSRTLAAGLVTKGKVRLNRERTDKPSQTIRPGDVITLTVNRIVRVLIVLKLGVRRGPAKEAVELYEDLSPAPVGGTIKPNGDEGGNSRIVVEAGAGRPTKKDRRALDRLKGGFP